MYASLSQFYHCIIVVAEIATVGIAVYYRCKYKWKPI